MSKGKIVIVPFPFDDALRSKPRPALCLTEPIGPHEHIVVAFISSQVPHERALESSDILIREDTDWFSLTGLKSASVLKLHRVTTIAARHIKRELGKLPQTTMDLVATKLAVLFGIPGQPEHRNG